jgi:DNA invertase Pin-like site-specific DNA recombinase
MKLVAYARASTEDQQLTLDDQQEKLRQYAKLYDHEIVEMVVGSESAKTVAKRDGFQRALLLLRESRADGLLILKVDRLARDLGDGQQLLREYFDEKSKYRKHLCSVQDYIDTRTANGRLMLNFQLLVAQWEREVIAERTKSALAFKIKSGQRVGNVLYGFDLADDGKTLVPNNDEQGGLAVMRELRDSGQSLRQIAAELTKLGYKSKQGGPWSISAIARILKRNA